MLIQGRAILRQKRQWGPSPHTPHIPAGTPLHQLPRVRGLQGRRPRGRSSPSASPRRRPGPGAHRVAAIPAGSSSSCARRSQTAGGPAQPGSAAREGAAPVQGSGGPRAPSGPSAQQGAAGGGSMGLRVGLRCPGQAAGRHTAREGMAKSGLGAGHRPDAAWTLGPHWTRPTRERSGVLHLQASVQACSAVGPPAPAPAPTGSRAEDPGAQVQLGSPCPSRNLI